MEWLNNLEQGKQAHFKQIHGVGSNPSLDQPNRNGSSVGAYEHFKGIKTLTPKYYSITLETSRILGSKKSETPTKY